MVRPVVVEDRVVVDVISPSTQNSAWKPFIVGKFETAVIVN